MPIFYISSSNMTGLFDLALIRAWTITPGIAATYVLLCPLNSASSFKPPRDTLVNYFPSDLAMDLAIDVFPTPGGPCRHIIFPLEFPFLNLTAKNSKILYLTSFKPVWSLFRIFSATVISLISSVDSSQGISSKV